jgi:hypothetical protein
MSAAIQRGDIARIKALLRTPYIDFENGYKGVQHIVTASIVAVQSNSTIVLDLLLAQDNASVQVSNPHGENVFYVAAVRHDLFLMSYFNNYVRSHKLPPRDFLNTAVGGHTPMEYIVGTPLTAQDPNDEVTTWDLVNTFGTIGGDPSLGETLKVALANKRGLVTLRTLINYGASPDKQGFRGQTPIISGVFGSDPETYKFLVSQSNNLNLRDACGMSAMDWTYVRDNAGETYTTSRDSSISYSARHFGGCWSCH